ncbi:cytochrome c [Nitrobacter sp. TKz-YC01]
MQRFRAFSSRLALAIALWSCAPAAWADDAGRALYHGDVADPPPARIAGVERPGLTCAGCHGRDAAGGGEGRSRVPPIDGTTLASPSPKRPAYDATNFRTAVSQGRASDGRTLSLAMPRFDLSPSQSDSLWEYLAQIAEEDRRGVSADQVRILVPAMTENLADAERLRDELERQWAARGTSSIHGRRVVFTVASLETPTSNDTKLSKDFFLAMGPDLDVGGHVLEKLQRSGLPILGPRGDLPAKTPKNIISVRAGRDQVIGALLRLASPTTTVVMDSMSRDESALPSEAISPQDSIPPNSTRLVLAVDTAQTRSFVRANQSALKGRTVIIPLDRMSEYPDLIEDLLHQGTDVIVARPAGDWSDPIAYAAPLISVLDAALVTVGRPLTRTQFLDAVKNVHVRCADWPDLDYRRFPKNGTERVEFVRVKSR